jgi:hypothetical protein
VRHPAVAGDSHRAAVAGDNHLAGGNHRAAVAGYNHRAAVADGHPAAGTEVNHRVAVDSYRGVAEGWSAVAAVAVDRSWTPSNVDIRFIAALVNPNRERPPMERRTCRFRRLELPGQSDPR